MRYARWDIEIISYTVLMRACMDFISLFKINASMDVVTARLSLPRRNA